MTPAQFDAALRAFCRRRPFRAFLIEFNSGSQLLIGHPEAIGPKLGRNAEPISRGDENRLPIPCSCGTNEITFIFAIECPLDLPEEIRVNVDRLPRRHGYSIYHGRAVAT